MYIDVDIDLDDVVNGCRESELVELYFKIIDELGYTPQRMNGANIVSFEPENMAEQILYEEFVTKMLDARKGPVVKM